MKKSLKIIICCLTMFLFHGIQAQTADEIVGKHFQAMGGSEKWAQLKTMSSKTKFTVQGMDIVSSMQLVVNKSLKVEVEVMGNKIVTAIDEGKAWAIRPAMMGGTGAPEDLPEDQAKAIKAQLNPMGSLFKAKSDGSKIELQGKENLDGAEVYVLRVTTPEGNSKDLYVSANTYFILKEKSKVNVNGQMVDVDSKMSNYKMIDGLAIPHAVESFNPMLGASMLIETTEVEINPKIDPVVFKRP